MTEARSQKTGHIVVVIMGERERESYCIDEAMPFELREKIIQ